MIFIFRKECLRLVCKMFPFVSKEVLQGVCFDSESQRSFPGQITEVLTSTLEIEVHYEAHVYTCTCIVHVVFTCICVVHV